MTALPESAVGHAAGKEVRFRLFVLGFQVLFLELVLIRFLAGHIWNLGYFPNLVLLAAFIGFGFGFLLHWHITKHVSTIIYALTPALLLLFICFVFVFKPDAFFGFESKKGNLDGELFFTWSQGKQDKSFGAQLYSFLLWFLGVVAIFFLIGQRMAKLFRLLPPLQAYSLDIAGSLAGIVFFMAFSFFQAPAWVWFLVVALSFFLAFGKDIRPWLKPAAALPPVIIAAMSFVDDNPALTKGWHGPGNNSPQVEQGLEKSVEGIIEHSIWSPYQRLSLIPRGLTNVDILANGIGHQEFGSFFILSLYHGPYRTREAVGMQPFEDVLVIGAGAGNDVRAALEHGVKNIDAVDIDPGILQFGFYRSNHTPAPYLDPRVNTITDDGRHFLHTTDRKYDLIVFALTDSITKVSALAQLRLENYLYTLESFRRASERLKPGGWVIFYSDYREQWLVDKLKQMLSTAMPLGSEILHLPSPNAESSNQLILDVIIAMKPLEETPYLPLAKKEGFLEPATDDWPFPYMKERRIPIYYLVAMATVVGMVLLSLAAFGRRSQHSDPRFAVAFTLLGAAFLLLETKGVIQFSLLFGTTWLNNSLVFFAVLASVLLGIKVAQRVRSPKVLPVAAVLLLVSAAVSLAVPLGSLLAFGPLPRFLLAGALMFTPVFMANLIFSLLFRERQDAELYFGWNLLGATVGGVLEYLSIVTGYQLLGVVVLVLYAVALGAAWLGMRATSHAPAPMAHGLQLEGASNLPVQE